MLSTREVADLLQVHPTTIQNWIRKGYFPNAYKVGLGRNSPYVIPKADVDAFLQARRGERGQSEQE